MATVRALGPKREGKEYETTEVPDDLDLAFCCECGERVCWYKEAFHDEPVLVCEDCVAEITNNEREYK